MTPYFPAAHRRVEDRGAAGVPAVLDGHVGDGARDGRAVPLYRALAMTAGPTSSWLYFGATLAFGALFVLGMATLHLGNFPLKHWLWRAPAFGALEAAAESLTSLGLIFAHREPIGSERAHPHDWLEIAASTFFWRIVGRRRCSRWSSRASCSSCATCCSAGITACTPPSRCTKTSRSIGGT